MPNEPGDSWFSPKDILVSRLMKNLLEVEHSMGFVAQAIDFNETPNYSKEHRQSVMRG